MLLPTQAEVVIIGAGAAGISSGQAITAVEEVAKQTLPAGYEIAWSGQAFQEKRTGGSSVQAFVFAIIMVFLILAALYEKWSLPIGVILTVPFALLGALVAIWVRGSPNDLYFQIGLVTLLGLAAKNAILIVEYAVLKKSEGYSTSAAAIEAARLRFRPILMTSLAFILGVMPLAFSTGAGAGAHRAAWRARIRDGLLVSEPRSRPVRRVHDALPVAGRRAAAADRRRHGARVGARLRAASDARGARGTRGWNIH